MPYAPPAQRRLPITPRQVQIIAGIARGHSNERIAADLDITATGVHSHVHRISRRIGKDTGSSQRAGIVGYAYRAGILAGLTPEPRPPFEGLSMRLLQILNCMAHGLSDVEIGRTLHLSPYTVKTHAQRLYGCLNAACRSHAVALGYQHGLLQEPSQHRETA